MFANANLAAKVQKKSHLRKRVCDFYVFAELRINISVP